MCGSPKGWVRSALPVLVCELGSLSLQGRGLIRCPSAVAEPPVGAAGASTQPKACRDTPVLDSGWAQRGLGPPNPAPNCPAPHTLLSVEDKAEGMWGGFGAGDAVGFVARGGKCSSPPAFAWAPRHGGACGRTQTGFTVSKGWGAGSGASLGYGVSANREQGLGDLRVRILVSWSSLETAPACLRVWESWEGLGEGPLPGDEDLLGAARRELMLGMNGVSCLPSQRLCNGT